LALSKTQKQELAVEYEKMVRDSQGIILAAYSGLKTQELEGLRRRVREMGGEFHVVKNTLLERALQKASLPLPGGSLKGTTAVAVATEDVPALAKAIVDYARTSEFLKVKGAVIGGLAYSAQQAERLAELPPLPVLRAQLLGVINAPAGRLAGAVAASVRQLVNVMNAYAKKEAPAAG
jgi:large subunit ribosomal protein L10